MALKILQEDGAVLLQEDGSSAFLRDLTHVVIAESANISAGAATSTTAQLTAPTGKTSGDFQAGRISDDTNPLPSIDLGSDTYTELEWSLSAIGDLVSASDVLEFRVTRDGVVLDTYTVTPSWTIEAPTSTGNRRRRVLMAAG